MATQEDPGHESDELLDAMMVVHKRVLEGVAAWCVYVADGLCLPSSVEKNYLKAVRKPLKHLNALNTVKVL